jgi:hypothetical protein
MNIHKPRNLPVSEENINFINNDENMYMFDNIL